MAKLAAARGPCEKNQTGLTKNPLMCKGIKELLTQPELEGTGF